MRFILRNRTPRASPSNALLANLGVNLIVNFIDFRPFSMKFVIKVFDKDLDLGFVGFFLVR